VIPATVLLLMLQVSKEQPATTRLLDHLRQRGLQNEVARSLQLEAERMERAE
jgi:hypothetical protein